MIEEPEEPAAGQPSAAVDLVGLAQLWADQFQHFTTLGVAGAGGVMVLLQAELVPREGRWWLALTLFALTALVSTYGQVAVVDEATLGLAPGRKPRWLRGLALTLLGAAGGSLFASVLR